MYGEMQQLVSDDGGAIIPMFANFVFAMSDKIAHAQEISADWDLDGLKFAERWWFA
jgi:peptide/nickel transport system substrate-binding protein